MSNQIEKLNFTFVTLILLKNAATDPPALQPRQERAEAQTPSHLNRIDGIGVSSVCSRREWIRAGWRGRRLLVSRILRCVGLPVRWRRRQKKMESLEKHQSHRQSMEPRGHSSVHEEEHVDGQVSSVYLLDIAQPAGDARCYWGKV